MFSVELLAYQVLMVQVILNEPVMVCRCLKQIDELINILTENQDTVTVGENISEESENVDVRFVDFFFLGGIYMIPA